MSIERIKTSVENVVGYLSENPDEAIGMSAPVTAVMEGGLRCRATSPNGQTVVTDMPEAVGGDGAEPSPGWLSAAALATCDATRIALQAARVGVTLDALEVSVQSEFDDRGLFGMDDKVQAGPLNVLIKVNIGAEGVDEKTLREIVDVSVRCSPVGDGIRRATPTNVEVEIA